MLHGQEWFGEALTKDFIKSFIKKYFTIIWLRFFNMQIPFLTRHRQVFSDLETWIVWGNIALSHQYHLAKAAISLGANVKLILGPTNLSMDLLNIDTYRVLDSDQMFEETMTHYKSSDVVICSAAVSDFKPAKFNDSKIKKDEGLDSIKLKPTKDIIKELGKIKKNQYLIGFALETDDHIDNAKVKLKSKNLDAIIVNKIGDFNPISNDFNQIDFINSDLEITPFEWLTLKSTIGCDYSINNYWYYNPVFWIDATDKNDIDGLGRGYTRWFSWNWENTVQINQSFGEHHFSLLGNTLLLRH